MDTVFRFYTDIEQNGLKNPSICFLSTHIYSDGNIFVLYELLLKGALKQKDEFCFISNICFIKCMTDMREKTNPLSAALKLSKLY